MDDWTFPYPDVDPPATQPALLDHDGRAIGARRVHAQQIEAAQVGEFEQVEALDADADVPLPFATPPGAALTF